MWDSMSLKAFQTLKRSFPTAPVLQQAMVDASNTGVGAVLSQRTGNALKMHPVAFYLHKLSPAERNCNVGNGELLTIKFTLGDID